MTTIPASQIVNVIPGVEGATGNALVMNGLMLTTSWRIPVGSVQSFSVVNDAIAVGSYFGLSSAEYSKAQIYENGFIGATQVPLTLLVAQWTPASVGAWLLGGPFNSLTIAQIQGITSGTLNVTVDGYAKSIASLNLSSATSYSAAAGLIQTAFNASPATVAQSAASGAAIAAVTATYTAYISGNVMTVTSTPSSILVAGAAVTGTSVLASTKITNQLTGTTGGQGTYAVNQAQNVASETLTSTYGVMTLTGSNQSGTFSVNQTLTGGSTSAGTTITQLGTGVGAAGTYYVSPTQTVAATTISAQPTPVVVTYDSVSGGLLINSGVLGAIPSTIAFATGTLAATLFLTAQTGAIISQGADGATPSVFMTTIVQLTTNWATFFTLTDPDAGAQNGPGQKLLFAAWNSLQNNRYAYLAWDADVTPTTSSSASSSLGYQVNLIYDYSGTCVIYDPGNVGQAAFMSGSIASINFSQRNGRATMAFRSQSGIGATVTNAQVANNLKANNYNWYGAYATAAQTFQFFYPGTVSGPFLWLDSYVNQIYMNAQFQLDLMELLTQVLSVPYNASGYAAMEAACMDTILQMVNFGGIRIGVALSSLEVQELLTQAGQDISGAITNQGWFFQVQPATASIRQARTSPVCLFWYADGGSIQQITLNSILLL